MIEIPKVMSNDESKLYADVVVSQRKLEIAQCYYNNSKLRLTKYLEEKTQ